MTEPAIYPITIDQQDVDFSLRISISKLITIVLNVAGLDAEANGFGLNRLNEKNFTWVLSRFAIDIDYLPKTHEKIFIKTWISEYNRIISTRNFSITDSDGKTVARAVSQWSMIDMKARKAVDLTQIHTTGKDYIFENLGSPIDKPYKIPAITPTVVHEHKAAYSDIDFNCHVNAMRYFDLMLDLLPFEMLKTKQSMRVDLQYNHECYHGDNLVVSHEQKDDISMFEIKRNNEISSVKCMINWR